MSNQVKAQGYEGLILRAMVAIIIVGLGLFGCNWWLTMTIEWGFDPRGVVDNSLVACDSNFGCVSSVNAQDTPAYVAPLPLTVPVEDAEAILERVLSRMPNADIRQRDDSYFAVLIGSAWRNTLTVLEVYIRPQQGDIQIKFDPLATGTDIAWSQARAAQLLQLYTEEIP